MNRRLDHTDQQPLTIENRLGPVDAWSADATRGIRARLGAGAELHDDGPAGPKGERRPVRQIAFPPDFVGPCSLQMRHSGARKSAALFVASRTF